MKPHEKPEAFEMVEEQFLSLISDDLKNGDNVSPIPDHIFALMSNIEEKKKNCISDQN